MVDPNLVLSLVDRGNIQCHRKHNWELRPTYVAEGHRDTD
jgi:hypothetical protein